MIRLISCHLGIDAAGPYFYADYDCPFGYAVVSSRTCAGLRCKAAVLWCRAVAWHAMRIASERKP